MESILARSFLKLILPYSGYFRKQLILKEQRLQLCSLDDGTLQEVLFPFFVKKV